MTIAAIFALVAVTGGLALLNRASAAAAVAVEAAEVGRTSRLATTERVGGIG